MLQRILDELLPADVPAVDRHLIASSIVGRCLFHRVHRPIVKLLAGDELYESFTVARLADHVARFSLAALGCGPPVGVPTAWENPAGRAFRPGVCGRSEAAKLDLQDRAVR